MTLTKQEFDALEKLASSLLSGETTTANSDINEEVETYQMGLHTRKEAIDLIIWHMTQEGGNK